MSQATTRTGSDMPQDAFLMKLPGFHTCMKAQSLTLAPRRTDREKGACFSGALFRKFGILQGKICVESQRQVLIFNGVSFIALHF